GTIRMWDTQTRKPVGECLFNLFMSTGSLAISPDGCCIVTSAGRSIVVWDILFQDPPRVHPSFINFKASPAYSAEDPSRLAAIPKLRTWDGWLTDMNNNLVIWVLNDYRDSLLWRGMVKFMGRESLTVNFANACYGTEWTKCYQP
ncbi:hypothetical protein BD311DRAFT_603707, partial [Dichomitus squalens]